MPADHAQKPPVRKHLGTDTAHSTCKLLQISSDKVRIICNPAELTRKNLQRNGRYQNRHLENRIK
jgi:hypothetical protein